MATINGLYIFVQDEDMTYGVEVTEHPVETGIEISDHVKRKGATLSLTGEIVGKNAATVLNKIKTMHQTGTLCKYAGRTSLSNCVISALSTSHPHTIWGGCAFSMTLKEIRTASTSVKAVSKSTATKKTKQTTKTGTQQVKKQSKATWVYHKVKKGDTVWALVAANKAPYRNLSRPAINGKKYSACDWVMQKNQSAFSRKGDFGTLQIGKKLVVGKR